MSETKRERTHIEDFNRELLDRKNEFNYRYKTRAGLNEEIIR